MSVVMNDGKSGFQFSPFLTWKTRKYRGATQIWICVYLFYKYKRTRITTIVAAINTPNSKHKRMVDVGKRESVDDAIAIIRFYSFHHQNHILFQLVWHRTRMYGLHIIYNKYTMHTFHNQYIPLKQTTIRDTRQLPKILIYINLNIKITFDNKKSVLIWHYDIVCDCGNVYAMISFHPLIYISDTMLACMFTNIFVSAKINVEKKATFMYVNKSHINGEKLCVAKHPLTFEAHRKLSAHLMIWMNEWKSKLIRKKKYRNKAENECVNLFEFNVSPHRRCACMGSYFAREYLICAPPRP